MADLTIYEGNDKNFLLTIRDADEVPINITGYTFLFTVKYKISDSDDQAIIQKTITSHAFPTEGKTIIIINRADTLNIKPGYYPYDIQMENASGKRITILAGNFIIIQSVGDKEI